MYNQHKKVKALIAMLVSVQHNRFFVYKNKALDSIAPKKTEKAHLVLTFSITTSFSFSDKFSSSFSLSVMDGRPKIIIITITKLPAIIINSAKRIEKYVMACIRLLNMLAVVIEILFVIMLTSFLFLDFTTGLLRKIKSVLTPISVCFDAGR